MLHDVGEKIVQNAAPKTTAHYIVGNKFLTGAAAVNTVVCPFT